MKNTTLIYSIFLTFGIITSLPIGRMFEDLIINSTWFTALAVIISVSTLIAIFARTPLKRSFILPELSIFVLLFSLVKIGFTLIMLGTSSAVKIYGVDFITSLSILVETGIIALAIYHILPAKIAHETERLNEF